MRKGKLLLALSAVKRALSIGGAVHPTAHRMVVRFALKAQAQDGRPPVNLQWSRASITSASWCLHLGFMQA